jgi:hypothetical protein
MPVLAGAGTDVPGVVVLADQFATANRHVQQQAVEIAGEYQIAAGAEDEATPPAVAGKLASCVLERISA